MIFSLFRAILNKSIKNINFQEVQEQMNKNDKCEMLKNKLIWFDISHDAQLEKGLSASHSLKMASNVFSHGDMCSFGSQGRSTEQFLSTTCTLHVEQ